MQMGGDMATANSHIMGYSRFAVRTVKFGNIGGEEGAPSTIVNVSLVSESFGQILGLPW
jgi:hypothetical protein